MNKGKVILIGAGPGDPGLITLKAVEALKVADVVLYDALANQIFLDYAPKAEQIFVGKKPGVHLTQQLEINNLILHYVSQGKIVARLKGGDAYVFGRGHEEEVFIKSQGFDVEVIPGVSSFYSVPELVGLPLTRRGLSESFWVLTGTTKDLELATDLKLAAQSNATVVVLMGMSKLAQIVAVFLNENKGDLPVAIIQNGSTPSQKMVVGNVLNIIDLVEKNEISSPAIIVIGKVVSVL